MTENLLQRQEELKKQLEQKRQEQAEANARLGLAEEALRKTLEEIRALGYEPETLSTKLAEMASQIRSEQAQLEALIDQTSPAPVSTPLRAVNH